MSSAVKPTIIVSAVLSIHNRAVLFKRAIEGYLMQSLRPEHWEIVLVDDMSTEDLSEVYKPYLGRLNLRHIRIDHRRHPFWKIRHPNGRSTAFENWFHTPAITINAGTHLARGRVICLCHPEILHRSTNFEKASIILDRHKKYIFGNVYLGTEHTNQDLARPPVWASQKWDVFLKRINASNLQKYGYELYWYLSFLPKDAIETVGGVDFEYLHGVAGEDDDFRERVKRAGWLPVYSEEIEGLHQDHSNEREPHRIRDNERWKTGLERNRAVFFDRRRNDWWPQPANQGYDWTASECVVGVEEFEYKG